MSNGISGHPAFIAYWGSNKQTATSTNTQASVEKEKSTQEASKDQSK